MIETNTSNTIQIFGTNFSNSIQLSCNVGTNSIKIARYINKSAVECDVDFINGTKLPVYVGHNIKDVSITATNVSTVLRPIVLNITAQNYPATFTNLLMQPLYDVYGFHFREGDRLACVFNGIQQLALFNSSTHIQCFGPKMVAQQPSGNVTEPQQIEVSINDVIISNISLMSVKYVAIPVVVDVYPLVGYQSVLTIIGRNFMQNTTMCKLGTNTQSAIFVSETMIKCTINSTTVEELEIWISNDMIHFYQTKFKYINLLFPKINSWFPTFAYVNTNNVLTLEGSNFINLKGFSFKINNFTFHPIFTAKNKSVVIIQSAAQGKYNISQSLNQREYLETYYHPSFEWENTINLSYAIKSSIVSLGNEEILIYVNSFNVSRTLYCWYNDDRFSLATVINSSIVKCIPPFSENNWVLSPNFTIAMTMNFQDFSNSTMVSKLTAPTITSIYPKEGFSNQINIITLLGKNFSDTTICRINNVTTNVVLANQTVVICNLSIVSTNGLLFVDISPDGIHYSNSQIIFNRVQPYTVNTYSPNVKSTTNRDVITMVGSNFAVHTQQYCKDNFENTFEFAVLNDTLALCVLNTTLSQLNVSLCMNSKYCQTNQLLLTNDTFTWVSFFFYHKKYK